MFNLITVYVQDLSQRDGFLAQVPTAAEALRHHGYFTAHSGKWHLGGMREESRVERTRRDRCGPPGVPGPNQHGFYDLKTTDGKKVSTKKAELVASVSAGDSVLLKWTEKVNGKFTNYYLESVEVLPGTFASDDLDIPFGPAIW